MKLYDPPVMEKDEAAQYVKKPLAPIQRLPAELIKLIFQYVSIHLYALLQLEAHQSNNKISLGPRSR